MVTTRRSWVSEPARAGTWYTNYSQDSNYLLTGVIYPNAAPFNGETACWTSDDIGNRLTSTVNCVTQNYSYYRNGTNNLDGQRLQSDGSRTYVFTTTMAA